MITVYKITGNCVGGYLDSVVQYQAKETANSLIWPGRRLDKFKDVDSFRSNESNTLIYVYTLDPNKVQGHLFELRRRFREHLETVRTLAMKSESALAIRSFTHPHEDWQAFAQKLEQEE